MPASHSDGWELFTDEGIAEGSYPVGG